jgi:hypothetical protein
MKKPRFGAFFVKLVMQSLLKHDCYCYLRVTDYSLAGSLVNHWGEDLASAFNSRLLTLNSQLN